MLTFSRRMLLFLAAWMTVVWLPAAVEAQPRFRPSVPPSGEFGISFAGDDWVPFQESGKWGFKDAKGVVRIKPEYEAIRDFNGARAAVRKEDRWGMIDLVGTMVIEPKYAFLGSAWEGLTAAQEEAGGKFGFLGDKEWEIPARYAAVTEFHEGLAGATEDGKQWGFIDFRGKWIVKPQYEALGNFSEGLASFRQDGKYGYLTRRNEIILKPQYDSASEFRAGSATVTLGEKTLDIDKWGKEAPAELAEVKAKALGRPSARLYPTLLTVREGGRIGLKRKDGTIVVKPELNDLGSWAEGMIGAKTVDQWGLLDLQGRWIVAPEYRFIGEPSEGLVFAMNHEGKKGVLDRRGSTVIDFRFSSLSQFHEGLASASEDGVHWGAIDFLGNWVIAPKHQGMNLCYEGIIAFRHDMIFGGMTPESDILFEPAFGNAPSFKGGKSLVNKPRSIKLFTITRDGKEAQ